MSVHCPSKAFVLRFAMKRVRMAQSQPLLRVSKPVAAIRLGLTRLGVLSSHPAAFAMVTVFALLWIVFGWKSSGWQGAAAVATLVMTLLIQRAEHRDTQAIHGKLDEVTSSERQSAR
jgi:hypothetical protein